MPINSIIDAHKFVMTKLLTISQSPSSSAVQRTWPLYLILGIVTNTAIWGLALLYLKIASPSYTSDLAISLPAAGSATNVNLPGIGQATSQSESPYQNAIAQGNGGTTAWRVLQGFAHKDPL
ncbi:hypothetical protein [Argonema galeatum]|uniref:hypothetical protein n=1 Tax=Argonema galeatum TaxID=2942762 RepID=UPI0020124803|nr:hypothetical protein [Argonema galeatum]MCL1465897.1 hypothetical protein [Argonema galeatum A003/A1]